MEQIEGNPAFYNIRMKLKIYNVSMADFGNYRCLAKNSQGETTGDIELYGNFYRHAILKAARRFTQLWNCLELVYLVIVATM